MSKPTTCHGDRTPLVQLNDGHLMPVLGLGTWKSKPGEVRQAVLDAIEAGYRHIDCAANYENENEVGDALKEAIDSGAVTREELFVTSKLWNTHHDDDKVPEGLGNTLRDLKVGYVDLYLVHWPVTGVAGPELKPPISETWRAMEQLVQTGKARSIGVSNFTAKKLAELCEDPRTKIKPAVNQCELHPLLRQDKLLKAAQAHGVHMTAFSPLGSSDSAKMFKHQGDSLLKHPAVAEAAQELGRTPAQVLLRWGIQRGTSVVAKSVHKERIRTNLDVLGWELPEKHMQALGQLEPQVRFLAGDFWLSQDGPYRTLEELWDGDVLG